MIKTTTFEKIGFGKYADAKIAIVEQFTDGNDYEGTFVYIDGELVASSDATIEAIEQAFADDPATLRFIMAHK